jgi:SAM-dependent methyltransferase
MRSINFAAPKCCCRVSPANSARQFKNPARIFDSPKVKAILTTEHKLLFLDIGAGCLRNSVFLRSLGHRVVVLEVGGVEERFADQYKLFRAKGGRVISILPCVPSFDVVIATFVIETICDPRQRKQLLLGVRRCLRPKGFLIMSVRGPSDLHTANNTGVRCSDGYLTPNRTFSRSFSRRQLTSLLRKCGFKDLDFLHRPTSMAPELLHVIARR